MGYFEKIFKALADRSRLKVIAALEEGELCVCQITELLDFSQPTVSRHISVLQQAGLVESEKRDRWVFYRLADEDVSDEVQKTLGLLKELFENSEEYQQVKKQIAEIKSISPEELCRMKKEINSKEA